MSARSRAARHDVRVVAAWVVLAAALLPFAGRLNRSVTGANPVAGTESAEVDRRLRAAFSSPFHRPAFLVASGLRHAADSDSGRAAMRAIVAPLLASHAVVAALSPGSSLDTLLVGTNKTTAIVIVGLVPDMPAAMDSVRAITTSHVAELRRDNPELTLRWTGEPALVGDLRAFGAREARRAELRALPVSLIVSVLAFGSLAAATLAVAVGAVAIIVALGVMGLISGFLPASTFTHTLVPLVGLALTVDYVLFLTRRSRERASPASSRRTILLAAAVVAIGFMGLAVAPTGELRSAAVAGVVTCVVAAVAAISLTLKDEMASGSPAQPDSPDWLRWGRFVTARPFIVLVVCAVPLFALANTARSARLATTLEALLPSGMESADAYHDLEQAGRAGVAASLQVMLVLPPDISAMTPEGWTAYATATSALADAEGVADARSLTTIGNRDLFGAQNVLPKLVVDTYLSRDRHTATITVIPERARSGAALTALVRRVRAFDVAAVIGVPGARLLVAGLPAYALDYETVLRHVLPVIVIATSVATFLALLVALRAPVVALKAVVLNLLVAAAAVGAAVIIFQKLMHVPAIFPTVPVLAFGAAFGTSMDYELFLLGGVRDALVEGAGHREAIVLGVARTGGLITRAAAVMACLFVSFSTSALLPVAMVGTTLAIAVALDATVVRLALAPALLAIAGRWNWWPGRLDSGTSL